jgi:predicted GNAT superfamily acetyltransferase
MKYEINPAQAVDYPAIHQINEASVPAVSSISMDELQTLAGQGCYFGAVWVDGSCAGFLMAMRPGADYASPHYQWFSREYSDFVYVDRIAVAAQYKGLGLGRALYQDLVRAISGTSPLIACEVNLKPPNPDSFAFHTKLGFVEVGQLESEAGKKRVSLMAKKLTTS